MSALVKNRDLLPDCDGFVSKQQVREALLRVGISGKVVRETTDGNFDHLPGDDSQKRLNLFGMNTIAGRNVGGEEGDGPREHFRSTGIRDTASGTDADSEGAARFEHFNAHRRVATDDWTQLEISKAIAAFDVDPGETNIWGTPGVASNDVNEDHPARATQGCGPADSVRAASMLTGEPDDEHKCFSNLHGSISFMFQEFGTPTGPGAQMSAEELRALYLRSEYPAGFKSRLPTSCTGGAFGCDSCWQEYLARIGAAGTHAPTGSARDAPQWQHRYCRCMMGRDYTLSGGFNGAPNATAVALPGVLLGLSVEYATTCAAMDVEAFAGGAPASGRFDHSARAAA